MFLLYDDCYWFQTVSSPDPSGRYLDSVKWWWVILRDVSCNLYYLYCPRLLHPLHRNSVLVLYGPAILLWQQGGVPSPCSDVTWNSAPGKLLTLGPQSWIITLSGGQEGVSPENKIQKVDAFWCNLNWIILFLWFLRNLSYGVVSMYFVRHDQRDSIN